jgi:hypothetical protein
MKTGRGLFWIGVGAILAFAVTANTSVFNLHVAGYVIMLIGILGLVVPRRGYEWLGRRLYVRRTGKWPGGQVEETTYPPYVLRNPGTANARAHIPDVPSLKPDPVVAKWMKPKAVFNESEMPSADFARRVMDNRKRDTDSRKKDGKERGTDSRGMKEKVPGDTEVIEDIYEK